MRGNLAFARGRDKLTAFMRRPSLTTAISVGLAAGLAFGLAASARFIVVTNCGGVAILDRASRVPITTLSLGGTPRRPAIDPTETTVVVPNEGGWLDYIQ